MDTQAIQRSGIDYQPMPVRFPLGVFVCVTEAAMVRASSGSLSSGGSSAVATAASMPASSYPSRRSVRMTRWLIFWKTAAMAASLGGSHLTNQRFLRVLTTIY